MVNPSLRSLPEEIFDFIKRYLAGTQLSSFCGAFRGTFGAGQGAGRSADAADPGHEAFTPRSTPAQTPPFGFYKSPSAPLSVSGAREGGLLGRPWVGGRTAGSQSCLPPRFREVALGSPSCSSRLSRGSDVSSPVAFRGSVSAERSRAPRSRGLPGLADPGCLSTADGYLLYL